MFFKACSFDLEVVPLNINQMPTPDTCPIILASCHFNYNYKVIIDNKEYETRNIVLILIKDHEYVEVRDNKIIFYFNDEIREINKLLEILKGNDIITGYNINGFDFPHLIDRSRNLGIKKINIGNGNSNLYYNVAESKGFKVTKIGNLTGKILIDIMSIMKREDATISSLKKFNLKILKLEHVAKEILKIEKLEFPVEEMLKYWNNTGDVELRNKFIDYCSRDSELALMFFNEV